MRLHNAPRRFSFRYLGIFCYLCLTTIAIMRNRIYIFTTALFLLLATLSYAQPRVIFDTDIDSDVDDVGALAMLLNMHNNNEIELAAIIVTSDDPYAPTCVSAICNFYGLSEIPIGFLRNQPSLKNHSRYTRQISERFTPTLSDYNQAEDGTELYRRTLAESKNNSVTIITVGHLSSLMKFMQSSPDRHSPLSGTQLVNKKVRRWLCMGGQYPSGKEANFYRPDPLSTLYCLQNWHKPVVFCGWEIGNKVLTGGRYLKASLPENHPVYQAYRLYNDFASRPSWDQLAVYLLSKNHKRYISLVSDGRCEVNEAGENQWIAGKRSNHSYIRLRSEEHAEILAREIDFLMNGTTVALPK